MSAANSKHRTILEGFEHLDRDTYGPNKYIVRAIKGLIESNEIVNVSIIQLEQTIKDFNLKSGKQSDQIIILTKVIAVLTILMLIGLIIQIVIAKTG